MKTTEKATPQLPTLKNYIFWLNSLTRTEFCDLSGHKPHHMGVVWEWALWNEVKLYAKFINKPLSLGQFIPCNEEGEPIEKPIPEDISKVSEDVAECMIDKHEKLEAEYQKALDKVLFEGWVLKDDEGDQYIENETRNTGFFLIGEPGMLFHGVGGKKLVIEDVIHSPIGLILTKEASKSMILPSFELA